MYLFFFLVSSRIVLYNIRETLKEREDMVDYEYKIHEYRGYALVKSKYGGAWHVHAIGADNEIKMFKELGFGKTLSEVKKIVDELEKKNGKKKSK